MKIYLLLLFTLSVSLYHLAIHALDFKTAIINLSNIEILMAKKVLLERQLGYQKVHQRFLIGEKFNIKLDDYHNHYNVYQDANADLENLLANLQMSSNCQKYFSIDGKYHQMIQIELNILSSSPSPKERSMASSRLEALIGMMISFEKNFFNDQEGGRNLLHQNDNSFLKCNNIPHREKTKLDFYHRQEALTFLKNFHLNRRGAFNIYRQTNQLYYFAKDEISAISAELGIMIGSTFLFTALVGISYKFPSFILLIENLLTQYRIDILWLTVKKPFFALIAGATTLGGIYVGTKTYQFLNSNNHASFNQLLTLSQQFFNSLPNNAISMNIFMTRYEEALHVHEVKLLNKIRVGEKTRVDKYGTYENMQQRLAKKLIFVQQQIELRGI